MRALFFSICEGDSLRFTFLPEDRASVVDAFDRLSVLFPDATFYVDVDALVVDDAAVQAMPILPQAIHDQLVRARYTQATAALRERLYNRLLG